jgi:hypothetical protein
VIQVEIQNDCTGTEVIGNYDVRVLLPGEGWVEARVENFDRRDGWVSLVTAAVVAAERSRDECRREQVAHIVYHVSV